MDEELELTRAQLAQRIGFSQSVIRKWEKDFSEFVTSPAGVKGLAKARVYNLDDVLLFGSETAGAPEAVHAAADARVVIPLRPDARSLNLSVSAGIGLFEALRQTGGLASPGSAG